MIGRNRRFIFVLGFLAFAISIPIGIYLIDVLAGADGLNSPVEWIGLVGFVVAFGFGLPALFLKSSAWIARGSRPGDTSHIDLKDIPESKRDPKVIVPGKSE